MQMQTTTLDTRLFFGVGGDAEGITSAGPRLWIVGTTIPSFYPIGQAPQERNAGSLRVREAEAMASDAADLALGAPAR